MSLKSLLGRALPASVVVALRRRRQLEAGFQRAIAELEGCVRTDVFPKLPPCDGRLELLEELIGTGPSQALHLLNALHESLPANGEVCELGVAQGATSALLANELRSTSKQLWLFDSFEGLPAPTSKDVLIDDIFNLGAIERYEGTMACGESEVRRRVAATRFPNERLHVVAGFVSDATPLPPAICFAYIDFDFYAPIALALKLVDACLSPGGAIVVDDYGHFSAGAKTAVDEFVAAHDYEMSIGPRYAGHFVVLRRGMAG